MIDHKYRCIYIHQRKCAGSSIVEAFGYSSLDGKGSNYWLYNDGVDRVEWKNRPSDYFVFSSVRNPFDKLVSAWKGLESLRDLPLEQLVENWPTTFHEHIHFTRPQVKILRDKKTGKLVTQDIIRFESMQEDFDRICDRLGKRRLKLPHVSYGPPRNPDYRSFYTPRTRDLVAQHFTEDLKEFGYDF